MHSLPIFQTLKKMEIQIWNQKLNQMSNNHKVLIALAGIIVVIFLSVNFYLKRKKISSNNDSNNGEANRTSTTEATATLPRRETYEVFLSFRGEDTRKDFTDHLYERLISAGVWVFRDNEALRVGEKIGPQLVEAIKASKISIPIISSEYASSKWCLQELVHILECKERTGQVVLPIFYRVDPSSVRHQTGTFEKAFCLHEKKYGSNSNVVQDWRNALAEVSSLKGWESSKIADGHEGQLVEIVVTKVLNELKKATLTVTNYLVGVEDHLEKILKVIEGKESSDVQAIVIHGMGGVGKTTLAKIIYNRLSTSFRHCSFISNIRERLSEQNCRQEDLQQQLISDILGQQGPNEISHVDEGINIIKDRLKEKKVLILFDDVDHNDQLNALARECNWFKSGSILIVTTRNKDIMNAWEGRLSYELKELDFPLSFLLFCKHAFRRDECPIEEFHAIAKDIVSTTGGLPLAIEIIGSMLLGKSKSFWEGIFKKLQKIPHKDVQKKLKISYDALEHEQKQIFLDIACLSIHKKMNSAFYMWDDCDFFPEEGVEKLISMSLIKMGEEEQLSIHDQLRDLGREIVRQEDYYELGNRSRLWIKEEAFEVIQRKQGTAKVQALNLFFDEKSRDDYFFRRRSKDDRLLTSEQFKDLTNLRFLQLKDANLVGDFKNLLLELRWLQWEECPPVFLPTNFSPPKLVILDLSYSGITEQWGGWDQIKLTKKLKVLTLRNCYGLTSTPDFSAFQKLEVLNLCWCANLRRIHPSICNLNKTLRILDVHSCVRLEELPTEMSEMEELRQLLVDGTPIGSIPISEGFMTKLEILSASGCVKLQHLPESIGSLTKLVTLCLNFCHLLTMLPESVGNLKSLTELNLQKSKVMNLPDSIGDLHNLKVLNISSTSIEKLPATIGKLRNLQHFIANHVRMLTEVPDGIVELISLQTLDLSGCEELKSMPNLPCSLTSLNYSGASMETLPNIASLSNLKHLTYHDKFERRNGALNIASLNNLESLSINGYCHPGSSNENIELVLELPSSLKQLHLSDCPVRALPSLSNFTLLSSLEIVRCENLSIVSCTSNSMAYYELKHCNALESSPNLPSVRNLKLLIVWDCMNLVEIQGLDGLECLETLEVGLCPSLERLGDLSRLKMLRELILVNCKELSDFDGIDEQMSLKTLRVVGCHPKTRSLNLSKLKNLEFLEINQFEVLTEISILQKLEYLKEFIISYCNSLDKLSDISLLASLTVICINGCEKLTEIKGLHGQKNLKILDFSNCKSLERLPDFSPFTNLKQLIVKGCEKLTEIKGLQGKEKLKILDFSNCKSLENLPDFSLFSSLNHLIVTGCEKLIEIKGLPMSLGFLDISGCKSLASLPDFSQCFYLKGLLAGGCNKLTKITGFKRQKKLKFLDFCSCKSLKNFPDFSTFAKLKHLNLNGCEELTEIKLPTSLETLDISGCKLLANLPDFSCCRSLVVLLIGGHSKLTNIMGTLELSSLEILDLSNCKSLEYVPDFSLPYLKHLNLNGCEKLTEIKGLPMSLETLDISGCKSLANLPDFSQFYSLEELLANGCSKLTELRGLEKLQRFRVLAIPGCESLRKKPDIPKDCIHTDPLHETGENITLTGKMMLRIHVEITSGGVLKYGTSVVGIDL